MRKTLSCVPVLPSLATIIIDIRRCGKGTLLRQLLTQRYSEALYMNFEDIRLAKDTNDFTRLLREIELRNIRIFFFDEIQIIDRWKIFIHQLLYEESPYLLRTISMSIELEEVRT